MHAGEEGHARPGWTNIKTWTGLPMEESIRMTEDRDKWRVWPTLGSRTAKEQNLCPRRGPPVALLRYTLSTSGFMDDVMFAHIGQEPWNRRRNNHSIWSSIGQLTPWRILKLTHQGTAPDQGRCRISTIALPR